MFLLSEFEHLGDNSESPSTSPEEKQQTVDEGHTPHERLEPHRTPVELLRHPDEPQALSQIKMSPFVVGACVVFVLLLMLVLIIMIAQLSSKISDMQRVMMMAMMR